MLEYTCPYCEKTVLIGDEEREKQVKCPHCDMLGVAYGVNIRSTDAHDVPEGHVAERHRPRKKKPKPTAPRREVRRRTPPPVPPAVPESPRVDEPVVPPDFLGPSDQDAPDLGPDQHLRTNVRRILASHTNNQARQLATYAVVSGCIGFLSSPIMFAEACCFPLPGLFTALAFLFAFKAASLQAKTSSRPAGGLIVAAVALGVIGVVLMLIGLVSQLP